MLVSLQLALSLLCVSISTSDSTTDDGSNRCKWLLNNGKQIRRFSAVPGGGWDNLRNKDMGQVADLSFSDCLLSDDGKYVLPRSVILYPRKESVVSVNAEVIEHYNNYTDSLSTTVNVGGNGIIHSISIGGKFSEEYQRVKSIAMSSRTEIARTQARYHLYSAKLQPDFTLSTAFRNRMMDIANALINNQTKQARYLADLVVRDFGTHFITSIEAGGVLEQRVFFDRSSITKRDFMQNKFSVSMSVGFMKIIGFDASTTTTTTQEDIDQFKKSVKKSDIVTHGGPIMASKMNATAWEHRLLENLVAIDRDGEPIYNAITQRALPGVPVPYMTGLTNTMKKAVLRYYHANVIKGCQDPNSRNFDPLANVNGQCDAPLTNFSFGGVYQECTETNPGAGLKLCSSLIQKNPITGGFSCPTGYDKVKLLEMTGVKGRRCWEKRKRCWVFFTCDNGQECVESSAELRSFWCAAAQNSKLPQNSGMVFGGAYSKDFVNPVTNAASCLSYYRPYRIGSEIYVCLSRDFLASGATRIPFAGFFSCHSGNPLSEPGRHVVSSNSDSYSSVSSNYNNFPQRCPEGFSQMTLDIVEGCSLMVCEKFVRSQGKQFARRPPFESPTYKYKGAPVVQVTNMGRRWQMNQTTGMWHFIGFVRTKSDVEQQQEKQQHEQEQAAAGAVSAIIGILCTTAAVAAIAFVAFRYARRRLQRGPYRQESSHEALHGGSAGYGTLAEEEMDEVEVTSSTSTA